MSSTQLTTPHAARARAGTRRARAVRAPARAPWVPGDRLLTAAFIVVGVALIVIAWIGASDTTDWNSQLRWTALSMVGVVVACIGVGIWLFRGFSRVRAEAREVRRLLAARVARRTVRAEVVASAGRVTVTGMAHHHRPDCLLVTGKTTSPADESTLAPCGVCA